jgi:hypothetical protein
MINSAADCWISAKGKHAKYFDENVKFGLERYQSGLTAEVYDFIICNLTLIRDGEEEDFRIIQASFDLIYKSTPLEDRAVVDSAIRKIFDYDAFAAKRKLRWCAYRLCDSLSFKTCPYCNLSYEITEWESGNGKIRPALDHFFDRSRYPLFAISLGNLVPSCHHCNSTFKGTEDFFNNGHLNPLVDSEKIRILLDVDIVKARYDLKQFATANIRLNFDGDSAKESNTVKTFDLRLRYQGLIGEIRDIARGIVEYSATGNTDPIALGWVLRNVDKGNYCDRIFGKMIMDMSSEYM